MSIISAKLGTHVSLYLLVRKKVSVCKRLQIGIWLDESKERFRRMLSMTAYNVTYLPPILHTYITQRLCGPHGNTKQNNGFVVIPRNEGS